MKKQRVFSLSAHAAPALLLTALLAGCGATSEPESVDTQALEARTYSVHGVIKQLPDPDQAGVPLLVRHEAIPNFLNVYGQEAPMDAMTMPFTVSQEVSLEQFAVGDPIAFELEVDWNSSPALAITAIEKLPPETVLNLADD